jgi:5'-nucleotidase
MKKLRILVTNDDGILASGLRCLVAELAQIGTVFVAAPDQERSATGHAITMFQPLRAKRTEVPGAEAAYAVSGTPADCVKLAVDVLFPNQIDLIVSGINRGANLGTDVLYSGTVSAALEGVMLGLPAIALSLAEFMNPNFAAAASLARHLVEALRERSWPSDTLLNINFPQLELAGLRGIKVTTLGHLHYDNPILERKDPWGGTYYWLAGQAPEDNNGEPTDVWAVKNGYVSLTPIQFDLTNYRLLDTISSWNLQLPKDRGR